MHPDQPPAPSRRTLLRGAAALTTVAFLTAAPLQPAAAAVPERPGSAEPEADPHPSYASIVGLL
ncbi:hypothetical protein [Streptomyces sp. MB09-02B]|uniref:hypothetical protein n=1 Tax=Streptomyces sp. MB09-02B TaxID=3028667 RepID=UPI0029A7D3D1|nr:hypothetical protein [Streptomyces sp. MB09-02B]MDX3641861.1 hypothetical protein [Streptomyces sp. MB09-02B]